MRTRYLRSPPLLELITQELSKNLVMLIDLVGYLLVEGVVLGMCRGV